MEDGEQRFAIAHELLRAGLRIDRVRIKRDHAFLIPAGAVLPFPARGPVFRFS